MRNLRKTLVTACFAIGLASLMSTASAAEAWGAGTITRVYPLANGAFVITLSVDPSGCPNTSSPKYLYVVAGENGVTADGVKAMLATSLAAAAMDKTVHVAFSDSSVSCYVNRLAMIN